MRIRNRQMLTCHGNTAGREVVTELLDAGLDTLDPYLRVKRLVRLEGGRIVIDDRGCEMRGDPRSGAAVYDLADYDRVFVIGAAKGVQRAARALEELLGDRLTGGHVIDKHGEDVVCKRIGVTLAGHPVPDGHCAEGCEKIIALSRDITERDLVFFITGSGCSSLMTCPAGDITVREVSEFTRMMQIEKGVPTSDLNRVRVNIDRLKGGRVTRLFAKAAIVNMTTADPSKTDSPVLRVGYREMLENNTFFPTLPAAAGRGEAVRIIKKWDAWDDTPESIRRHLLSRSADDGMSAAEYEALNARFFGLIFKDATVYPAVRERAAQLGYRCVMLSEYMEAEAREAGRVNALTALCAERMGEPFQPPVVLMTSGENVVTVGRETGVGGRNQEYCTAAALKIRGSRRIVFGAVDTDGTDGPGGLDIPGAPRCLAGAVVDGYTFDEAQVAGIDLEAALATHGTSRPLWELGCGVDAQRGVSALDLGIILIT